MKYTKKDLYLEKYESHDRHAIQYLWIDHNNKREKIGSFSKAFYELGRVSVYEIEYYPSHVTLLFRVDEYTSTRTCIADAKRTLLNLALSHLNEG